MDNLTIREPKPEEYRAVVDLTNAAFNVPTEFDEFQGIYNEPYELFLERVAEGAWHVLVALLGDTVVGAVRYQFLKKEPDTVWLFKLAVLPEYRKHGVAPKLMQRVEEIARDAGRSRINLEAMQEKGLPDYYKKFGFVVDSVKENHGHHDVMMSKSI